MVSRVLFEWGVGKYRDLPAVFKADYAFNPASCVLPKVVYISGNFYKVIWCVTNPLYWPEPVLVKLDSDDTLVITKDWGIEARILGAMFNSPARGL